ncbi:efflux RND transporter periplasmic adaptor subunit [Hyalangium rubrum]|uniref:Efflux RND transporter periplasmic adaptor subunit n=1 Tax=Hyalangium rubrum TaxID=3103134 RepID=A0ABU5GY68_9BACT|nr:efflux RND transporter periplasmic adaptor subunit [Hyalangium sp. s54d21]MDY7225991.1 efflux RND transporter periplasmic adaptor subunit [Hyalangium sp. s54d21]
MRQVPGGRPDASGKCYRTGILLGALVAAMVGCDGQKAEAPAAPQAEAPVALSAENVTRAEVRKLESGPVISGSLQARRAATLRAEVGGALLEMKVEQGQAVKRGELLARIDDATLQDQLIAARSAARVAENALQVSKAEEERNGKLAQAGVITQRDFDRVKLAREQAEAQLSEAQARLALSQEQLARTRISAPFDGAVSERQANAGDVIAPGTPLVTVVDPTSLRLEAAVPAEHAGKLQAGTPVDFRVSGYGDQGFTGKIERVNPVVDPTTGQVRIYVAIPNVEQSLLAGLFAQGRVASESREALSVPVGAVDLRTASPTVLRVKDGKVERAQVELGLRDDVAQRVEVRSGLQAGDVVVMGSARELAEGTRVEVAQAPAQPAQPTQGLTPPTPR